MDMNTPPAPPPRRGPAPTKHIDILWAAARLFSRRGVAQTTTREVAAEAGTTERTLFKHFGSKDGLVQAVMTEAVMEHLAPASLEALRQQIESHGGDMRRWHTDLLWARSRAIGQSPELTRLLLVELLRDQQLREQFASEWLKAAWEPLLSLFRRLQRDGQLRKDLPAEALARMFLSLNIGQLVARHVLAPQADWKDEQDFAGIAQLFAAGAQAGARQAR
jgi:AcrR family transcriptional regulator